MKGDGAVVPGKRAWRTAGVTYHRPMDTFALVVVAWMAVAVVTLPVLLRVRAPYGRHVKPGWGPTIGNRWGWFLMELPALLLMPLLTVLGPREKDALTWLLVGLWCVHYVNRTLIFPFRLNTQGKRMPLAIVFSAIGFNAVNGGLNGWWLGFAAPPDRPVPDALSLMGTGLFVAGMLINHWADTKLIGLRARGTGYVVPRGGLFERISCPNHFGEIAEWTGFALAAWSLPALSFAVWSFCNLAPRARNHHAWYRERFPDYPAGRRAVIPYIW